jgi:hypothetical protein
MPMQLYHVCGTIEWTDVGDCAWCLKADECLKLDCDYGEDGMTSVDVLILASSSQEAKQVAFDQEMYKYHHSYGCWVGMPLAVELSESAKTHYLEAPENSGRE